MNISDLLARDGIVVRGSAGSKRQALHRVADAAAARLDQPAARIMEALVEREALGSTGLGGGVAVPHARIEGLDHVTGVFVRLDEPVSFDAVDDRPVDLLFALFAPPKDGAEHLRALAAVSRALRSQDLRQRLREAASADEVHALFLDMQTARAA